MSTIAGRGGMVYLQGLGASATKLGEVRSWKIDIDAEYEDTTEFGDVLVGAPWSTQQVIALKWRGVVDGNMDTATVTPFNAITAREPRALYLYTESSSFNQYYYGTIWPRLSVDAQLRGPIRFEMEFDGDGQLGAAGS